MGSLDATTNSMPHRVIEPRSLDEARPLKVVVMGAGISGILASIRFPQRIQNLSLTVYEKNADVGGTWYENRYPGCACDIPAHTYQATFEPNHSWSRFYASASEIHQYWKRVAMKYGCMKYIKLRQKVVEAKWNEGSSQWDLKVEDVHSGTIYYDSCNLLISGTGALNDWKWPNIPGLSEFKGKLLHSASWDETYDWTDKRIAVIGNGSSGIQIVPAMLPKSARLDHYIRGKTWVSPTFARGKIDEMGGGLDNFTFTAEHLKRFANEPNYYQNFRKEIELELQSVHGVTVKGSPEQIGATAVFTENMKKRLEKKPSLIPELMPSFPPVCRRLTPGPGYLEALSDDKCEVISNPISHIDATGIQTADGKHRPVDAIVCATGFNTTYSPRFPIFGRQGVSLAEKWKEIPKTYISIATDNFPNYFISLGPNAGLGSGNLLLLIEKELDYFTACAAKMQRDNIRSMAPRRDAVETFVKYCDSYFEGTVFAMKCKSWYKGGTEDGRINALWPGSSLHSMKVFSNPRWEDFEYKYHNDNPVGWLGDGWTENEKLKRINVDYLDSNRIDFPAF